VHAEPMLFVDHDQPEIAEGHSFLEQGMRADDDVEIAGGRSGHRSFALIPAFPPGEQPRAQTRSFADGRESAEMLARQQFGRRHEGRLGTGFRDSRHCHESDRGLAAAHITLEQPQHPFRPGEIGSDVGDGLALGAGQLEGQGGRDAPDARSVADACPAACAVQLATHQQQRDLSGEKLVIGQP
jgi:hypothetical protein